MLIASLDHIVVAVADLEAAAAPFERLGLSLTPAEVRGDRATVSRVFFVGDEQNEFYVELLAVHDPAAAARTGRALPLIDAVARGGGAYALALATEDLVGARAALARFHGGFDETIPTRADGSPIADLLRPADAAAAGCAISVLHYAEPLAARRRRHATQGHFRHELPLRRLDHLALWPVDIAAVTATWQDVLGVRVHAEVPHPAFLLRQLKIGDAMLELIAPLSADSPAAARPKGLSSMAAFEVADLEAAVKHARGRGFTIPDPAPGALPGTQTATISADQLSGCGLQLLQYV